MKIKLFRKMTALVLAIMLVLNFSAADLGIFAAVPETIAAWDYTAAPASAVVPATSGTLAASAALTNFKSATPTYGTTSLSIGGWDNGADTKYWQISLSTKGYENLTLAAKTRSSGTGPRDFKVIYSVDNGTTWTDAPGSVYAITGTALSNYMPTLSLPAAAADAEKLLLRCIMTSNISSRAGTSTYAADEVVASGGTSNINNIVVAGTPIGGTVIEKVASVTANPTAGAVSAGTQVALSTATDGAKIMYALNESTDFIEYVSPITINAATTIKAYGIKEGLQNSDISQFVYTLIPQLTIAEAKSQAIGSSVIVEGKVTTIPGSFGSKSFYIQDATAGALIFTSSISTEINIGNTVKITGKTADYQGKFEIAPTAIEVIDAGTVQPDAKTVSLSKVNEDNEGTLIKLRAVKITDITSDTYKSAYIKVSDGLVEVTVKLDNRTGQTSDNVTVKVGDYVDVIGVVEQSKASPAEYRVMIRSLADISSLVVTNMLDARGLAKGSTVTIQGIVTSKPGSYGSKSFYIQDSTSGALVFTSTVDSTILRGTRLLINGKTDSYAGKFEIVPTTTEIISQENVEFTPKLISIADITEANEAILVKLEDVKVKSITSDTYNNATIAVYSGENNANVKLDSRTGFGFSNLTIKVNDLINVTGIVEQSKEIPAEYRITLRDLNDVSLSTNVDTVPPTITHTAVTQGNTGLDLDVTATVTDDKQIAGVKLYYRVKGTTEYSVVDMQLSNSVYAAAIPKTQLSIAGMEYYIEAADGTNTVTSPTDISTPYQVSISASDISGPAISNILPADKAVLTETETKPHIYAEFSDASGINAASIKLLVDGVDVTASAEANSSSVSYYPSQNLAVGMHVVALEVNDTLGNKTTFTWNFIIGEEQFNIYFGQLHSHTSFSDGLGTVDEAYNYAKNTAKVDFLAVTDHSNSLDNASTSTINDGSGSTEWQAGHTAADKYTDASFVGVYAYEMTWSNGTGHINTFNTLGFENRDTAKYKALDGLKQYYEVLKQVRDSISQLNHPGPTFGDFNDFAYYDPDIDQRISLIEVGNGEKAIGSNGYFPSYEFYTRALDKGWHVSPTNNQDNHLGKWGDANTAKTVVLADSLTRNNIYDAMRNMRTYATEDKNLRIKYTLNGKVMGTVFDQKPASVNIKVDLEDPDNEALGKISVISNGGKVVESKVLSTSRDVVQFTLTPDYSYYYIRIDEADSDIAVTAPVWIGEVDKAGISKTTASTTLPVKGENLKITTSLFNNEAYPMTVNSLIYSINGTTIHEASAINPINSLSTGSYTFDYTPTTAGRFNIDVRLAATINGVEKVFTDVLKLDVTDPVLVTKVVADGSHYNDYVNGYYANNLGNFTILANSKKIAVNIEKTKLTADVLKDAKLLIISAPAKKTGTANGVSYEPQSFSAEDIAVIKDFVDHGGNLLVCGIADYQDGTGVYQTTTQMNAMLEGIGATTRFNNDEVIDNTQKLNNQNFRLAFDDYNMDSPYLAGVQTGQPYSFYSGCSINIDPASLASGKTTWLVKGHDTTESIDSNSNLTGVALPKGSVYALAVEQLNGGGKMFIGGTVYISDFEVKAQLDNATQLQNSNYNIVMNILNSIKNVIPTTPISQVRTAPKGTVYSVEGIVTAGKSVADNSFFDTLYIQDATGGINIFPVSATDISIGQKVKVIGTVDEYQGDIELRVIEYSITDTVINPISPTVMTTKAAMESQNGGMLVKVEGIVKNKDAQNLYVDDGTGIARVFVDGYIGDGSGDPLKAGKWDARIQIGDRISAIGLASVDPQGARLRVRNTAEIVWIQGHQDNSGGSSTPDTNQTSSGTTKETTNGTATITQNENGNTAVVLEVDTDKLKSQIDAATSDKITIDAAIDRNAKDITVNLPADLLASLSAKDKLIEVNTGTAVITLDPSTITVPAGGQLSLRTAAISDAQAKLILPQTGNTNYNMASTIYDFELVTIKDSKETKVEFNEPLSVAISFDQSKVANVNKLGIYYYNETTKTWEYAGGRIIGNGQISFDAEHFSKYAVMEYNKSFGDINIPWAKEAIEVMASRHVIDGIGGDKFAPNDIVTRAQFAKMLVKALNLKANNSNVKFTDVKQGAWFESFVYAAASAGITNGSNGRFEPELEITREMMATMIVRAMKVIKPDANLTSTAVNFSDKGNISDWAMSSVEIAYSKGLINGTTKDTYEPKKATTRAQAAVMIYRLLDEIGYVK